MNIELNVFDFFDLTFIILIPVVLMSLLSIWLVQSGRRPEFLLKSWGVFAFVIAIGIISLLAVIQIQRQYWLGYFADAAKTYANIVTELDHWKIELGDPELFSEWSDHISPEKTTALPDVFELFAKAESESNPASEAPESQLAVPENLIARIGPRIENAPRQYNQWIEHSLVAFEPERGDKPYTQQALIIWNPVEKASAYRLEWAYIDPVTGAIKMTEPEEEDEEIEEFWVTVYSGSKPFCLIDIPEDLKLLFRVRAETGTPEDDPVFARISEIFAAGVEITNNISYIYTMRPRDEDNCVFVVSPASDANHNGKIDPDEEPSYPGEVYGNTPLMNYVLENKVGAINSAGAVDKWGGWISSCEPLYDPEGEFDCLIGVDFPMAVWVESIQSAKFWPYCFFTVVSFLYFGCVVLIAMLQRSDEESRKNAIELRNSVEKLTEAKQAAELAARAKSHFLANMSHEIRTPMNAILGFADILGNKLLRRCLPDEREQCEESLRLMTGSGRDLLRIINDILDFSKADEGQVSLESIPVSFTQIIEDVQTIMQERLNEKPGLELVFSCKNKNEIPEWIKSDPTRIRQILINIIGNAIKFTENGSVSIVYGYEKPSGVHVRPMTDHAGNPVQSGTSPTGILFTEVTDTGIGISDEQISNLFQPFSQADSSLTRRFGGTGLGLSISKRLAVLLGGDIHVSSRKDIGSTFTFTFHANICEPSEATAESTAESTHPIINAVESVPTPFPDDDPTRSLEAVRVLVVEDGRVNQIVISAQLKEAGAVVELADNGQIALNTINQAEKDGKPFDVVLMDMQMPVMDGYEATAALRKGGYKRPVIAITAHALSGDCEKTLEVGCDAYLSKPIDFQHLIATVSRFRKIGN